MTTNNNTQQRNTSDAASSPTRNRTLDVKCAARSEECTGSGLIKDKMKSFAGCDSSLFQTSAAPHRVDTRSAEAARVWTALAFVSMFNKPKAASRMTWTRMAVVGRRDRDWWANMAWGSYQLWYIKPVGSLANHRSEPKWAGTTLQ